MPKSGFIAKSSHSYSQLVFLTPSLNHFDAQPGDISNSLMLSCVVY